MRLPLLILLLLIFFCNANCQLKREITISGTVINENGQPLTGAYIKLTKINSSVILTYLNTGNSNSFSATLNSANEDTLTVTASYMGYQSKRDTIIVIKDKYSYKIEFNLAVYSKMLDGVIINAPPVWKRGDTTFYKVDSFKEGEEKKLIDIITKIPGFRIGANGTLIYKNSPVEKLMIEGEEIFTDKIQLLLKNIPVHVLNTIQALENQSSNKLLKGLGNDSKVFVNIGLKKDKFKAAFGDGEIGLGTLSRYKINPVLFSIYGKIKAGYIGNFNNNGQSLTTWEEYQLKSKSMLLGEYSGNIPTNLMQGIPNFADSRYRKNNFFDNRLQLNFAISKKIKTQLEVTYVKDKQTQSNLLKNTLFSNGTYFNQQIEGVSAYSPLIFKVQNKSIWSIDSTSEMSILINYDVNKTMSESNSLISQDTAAYITINKIQNFLKSISADLDYTKRVNELKAIHINAFYSYGDLPQLATGLSSSWPTVFLLPDTRYTILEHNFVNRLQTAKIVYEEFSKKNKLPISWQLNAEWEQLQLTAPLKFKVTDGLLPDYLINNLSGNGQYETGRIYNSSSTTVKVLKKPAIIKFNIGITSLKLSEPEIKNKKESIQALYKIELEQRREFTRTISSSSNLRFSQSPSAIYQLTTATYPLGVAQFRNRKNTTVPVRELSAAHNMYFSFKNYTSYSISLNYEKGFTNHFYQPLYNSFVLVSSDSIIKKTTNNYRINTEIVFPWLFLKAKIKIGGELSINQSFLDFQGQLVKANLIQQNLYTEIKRNWNKKIFLIFNSIFQSNINKYPKKMNNESISKSVDFINSLSLRVNVVSNMDIKLSGEWLQNNLYTANKFSGFFSDMEASYTIPKKKITVSIKLENITSQKEYFSISQYSVLSQSFFSIPLIKRNVFASLRYEL
jgi:hypothetical protein